MAWDTTEPTDTTKIRDLGTVIRPNWEALEQADPTMRFDATNYKDRTVASLPVNPTAIADTFIDFCKTDTSGNSEKFGIDENSNVIQFSYGGRMGGPTTNLTLVNFRFGASTTNYTRSNVVIAYGRFNQDGSTVIANNCSITRLGAGQYQVTLNPVATNTLYVPSVTITNTGNLLRVARVTINSASQFTINMMTLANVSADCGGMFHVCGGF
jgi:hypothetical protein